MRPGMPRKRARNRGRNPIGDDTVRGGHRGRGQARDGRRAAAARGVAAGRGGSDRFARVMQASPAMPWPQFDAAGRSVLVLLDLLGLTLPPSRPCFEIEIMGAVTELSSQYLNHFPYDGFGFVQPFLQYQ